jgi:hypothetical protein
MERNSGIEDGNMQGHQEWDVVQEEGARIGMKSDGGWDGDSTLRDASAQQARPKGLSITTIQNDDVREWGLGKCRGLKGARAAAVGCAKGQDFEGVKKALNVGGQDQWVLCIVGRCIQ